MLQLLELSSQSCHVSLQDVYGQATVGHHDGGWQICFLQRGKWDHLCWFVHQRAASSEDGATAYKQDIVVDGAAQQQSQ